MKYTLLLMPSADIQPSNPRWRSIYLKVDKTPLARCSVNCYLQSVEISEEKSQEF